MHVHKAIPGLDFLDSNWRGVSFRGLMQSKVQHATFGPEITRWDLVGRDVAGFIGVYGLFCMVVSWDCSTFRVANAANKFCQISANHGSHGLHLFDTGRWPLAFILLHW